VPLPSNGLTFLYRFYDDAGVLLYVGVSQRPFQRFAGHDRSAKWITQAAACRLERFPTRSEALRAETLAIWSEQPIHNIQGKYAWAVGQECLAKVLLGSDWVRIAARIMDIRHSYGRTDYLITPVGGSGQLWVSAGRLTVNQPNEEAQ